MKILIDADACPVTKIIIRICQEYRIPCILLCDTSHIIENSYASTLICDKGADSVDFELVNRTQSDDIVVTQDYGLASMCLAKGAIVINQDGREYTHDNIIGLMEQRHAAKMYRMAGGRTKGPKKRKSDQDREFEKVLRFIIQKKFQGSISGGSN